MSSTADISPDQAPRDCFSELPTELRCMIYDRLACHGPSIIIDDTKLSLWELLATSRVLAAEYLAHSMQYLPRHYTASATFYEDPTRPAGSRYLTNFQCPIPTTARATLRIRLDIEPYLSWAPVDDLMIIQRDFDYRRSQAFDFARSLSVLDQMEEVAIEIHAFDSSDRSRYISPHYRAPMWQMIIQACAVTLTGFLNLKEFLIRGDAYMQFPNSTQHTIHGKRADDDQQWDVMAGGTKEWLVSMGVDDDRKDGEEPDWDMEEEVLTIRDWNKEQGVSFSSDEESGEEGEEDADEEEDGVDVEAEQNEAEGDD